MKTWILVLAAIFSLTAFSAENLIVNPAGKPNFSKWWRSKPAAFSITPEGTLKVTGLNDAAAKKYFKSQHRIQIPAAKIAGTKFVLSAKVRIPKLSGKFSIAVREALAKQGTSSYHMIPEFNKWNAPKEWKSFSKSFTGSKGSTEFSLYLQCTCFDPADQVEIKDLKLEIVK